MTVPGEESDTSVGPGGAGTRCHNGLTMTTETEPTPTAVARTGGRAPTAGGSATARRSPGSTRRRPSRATIVRIRPRYGLFIGGREVAGSDGATFTTIDPATEEPLAEVARATEADVDKAIRSARRATGKSWGQLPGRERAKYLFRIARILQERSREFAVLESMDSGKPIKESRDVDVPLAAAHFWYYAGWADKLDYAFPGRVARPLGVAAQVIPWNFPLLMLAWKIAPALAAGNTVVLKPASTTPLSALLFAEVCRQADLPAGVVNIITGPGEIGMALVTHPGVDKVAFTGSTAVGKLIAKGIAGQGKALTLELGGKAANIVFEDAPLDQAIEGIVNGIYFNQGEVCCAGLAPARPGVDRRAAHRQAQGPPGDDPGRRPARQEHRRRGDQLEGPARQDHRARGQPAWPRAPSSTSRPASCPSAASSSARRCSRTSPRATGSPARRSSGRSSRR